MGKYFIIPLHLFPFEILIFIGCKGKVLKGVLSEYFDGKEVKTLIKALKMPDSTLGRFVMGSGNRHIISLKSLKNKGIIAHEIYHAVTNICDVMGIKWHEETEEVYAYMIQYITEVFYSNI